MIRKEAEKFLFSPHVIKMLGEKKFSSDVLEILRKGCELEDIKDLIPEELNSTLVNLTNEVLELLKSYPKYETEFWLDS